MRKRGVKQVTQANLFNESFCGSYDTLLMLMNGSGIIGRLENLPAFFRKAKQLLRPGGSILMDSSDLRYLYEDEDGSFVIDIAGDYYGEVDFKMQYKDIIGDQFDWLYIDFQTLSLYAAQNGFKAEPPKEKVDIVYLCNPSNPTGTAMSKEELTNWVKAAKENNFIIIYDSAYETYITEPDVPHSIFEIEGAKEVAIELRSYSKCAGFTGTRCSYVVVPHACVAYKKDGTAVELNPLWNRRQCTKFNGTPYIVQRAAEAYYSPEGQKQCLADVEYYMENAHIIRDGLTEAGFTVYGATNSPYAWVQTPNGMKSWDFFDLLLEKAHVVTTPGSGFGPHGEGYLRLTAFGTKENTVEAVKRIADLKLFK